MLPVVSTTKQRSAWLSASILDFLSPSDRERTAGIRRLAAPRISSSIVCHSFVLMAPLPNPPPIGWGEGTEDTGL